MRGIPGQVLIVTPHLGDAVLSCGELVAAHPGAVVLTVFAGIPGDTYVVPEWDALCGFSSPRQAVTVRRREERHALELLDAEPCWLSCPESQYRRRLSLDDVVLRLARAMRRHRAHTVAIPVGLLPGDHSLASAAAMRLLSGREVQWLAYDDAGAAPLRADASERLESLSATPLELPSDEYRRYLKRRAVESYESLQRGFERSGRDLRSCLELKERYWRLAHR